MSKYLSLSFALVAAALMSACGGDGDDRAPVPAPPPPAPAPADPLAAVPDSARQSADGLVSYLKVLSTTPSDTRDPIDLSMVTLPQSDTTEPAPL